MNNRELQDWINQHGGVRRQGATSGQDAYIDNPNYDPFDPDSPKKIKNPSPSQTITANDGAFIIVAQAEGSSSDPATRTYDVIDKSDAPAAKPAAPPAEEPDPSDPTKTRIWDPTLNNGAGGWKPGVPIAQKPSAAAGSIVEGDNGLYNIVKPDGTVIPTTLKAKPAAGSTTQVKGGDGKTYVVRVDQQGNVTTIDSGVPAEAKDPKTVTIEGTVYQQVQNPDGTLTLRPVPIQGEGTARPDVGQLKLEYGQIYDGLTQRRQQLQQQVELNRTTGGAKGMTQQQADRQFKEDYELAQVRVAEINNILSTQSTGFSQQVTQRGQSLDEVQSRRTSATGAMQNAMGNVFALGETVRPGSISGAEGVAAIRAMYNMQMQAAQQAGGYRDVPEIAVPPATAQVMRLSLPGGASLEIPNALSGLQGVRSLYNGAASGAPAGTGGAPGVAPAAPAAPPAADPMQTPQPALPPPPTAVSPMSIAQGLLTESDDPDWQYGVTKAMSLIG